MVAALTLVTVPSIRIPLKLVYPGGFVSEYSSNTKSTNHGCPNRFYSERRPTGVLPDRS